MNFQAYINDPITSFTVLSKIIPFTLKFREVNKRPTYMQIPNLKPIFERKSGLFHNIHQFEKHNVTIKAFDPEDDDFTIKVDMRRAKYFSTVLIDE